MGGGVGGRRGHSDVSHVAYVDTTDAHGSLHDEHVNDMTPGTPPPPAPAPTPPH